MKLTLREWRRARGLSQETIAQALGVHVNTYAAWEKNQSRMPVTKAFEAATVLDVDIDSIIFDA